MPILNLLYETFLSPSLPLSHLSNLKKEKHKRSKKTTLDNSLVIEVKENRNDWTIERITREIYLFTDKFLTRYLEKKIDWNVESNRFPFQL